MTIMTTTLAMFYPPLLSPLLQHPDAWRRMQEGMSWAVMTHHAATAVTRRHLCPASHR
jgi:hypothetical protein